MAALALLAIVAVLVSLRPVQANPVVRTIVLDQSPTAMVVDPSTERLFISTTAPDERGRVTVLDTRTAALLRIVPVGYRPRGMAIDERAGRVFVVNADTSMAVLDAHSGRVVRSVGLGIVPAAVAVDTRTAHVFVAGTALGWNGHAIVTADGPGDVGSVSVFDTHDATLVRTVLVGRDPIALVVDARARHVFVLNRGSPTVSVLDAHSGQVLRTRALDRGASAAGVPAGAMARAMDARTGTAFVANGDANSVSVLDVRRGVVLRTLAVGVHPLAVAIDEQAGRAFVVNYGGSVRKPAAWWAPWVSRLRRLLPPQALRTLPGWAIQVTAHTEPASVSVLAIAHV